MLRVGLIGWRGMVGSVLLQRMREERDFAGLEPMFFSTSNAGGAAPAEAGGAALADARRSFEQVGVRHVPAGDRAPQDR